MEAFLAALERHPITAFLVFLVGALVVTKLCDTVVEVVKARGSAKTLQVIALGLMDHAGVISGRAADVTDVAGRVAAAAERTRDA